LAARVYDEVFGYIEDATKTLPGAAAPGELMGADHPLPAIRLCLRRDKCAIKNQTASRQIKHNNLTDAMHTAGRMAVALNRSFCFSTVRESNFSNT